MPEGGHLIWGSDFCDSVSPVAAVPTVEPLQRFQDIVSVLSEYDPRFNLVKLISNPKNTQ